MSYSLRLTHLEPHSDSYVHVVRRVDPDIAQFMGFRCVSLLASYSVSLLASLSIII